MPFFHDFALTERFRNAKHMSEKSPIKQFRYFKQYSQRPSHLAELQLELWEVTEGLEQFIVLLGSLRCQKKY